MTTSKDLIEHFDLLPHPEGGYFRETYRSPGVIPDLQRSYSTGIYFLIPQGQKSHLHRLASDEMWHFYLGGPLTILQISPKGELKRIQLGSNFLRGEFLQYTVPAHHWFGSYTSPGSEFSFVGCTVSPGFDFKDFEMGSQEDLLRIFPQHKDVILKLAI